MSRLLSRKLLRLAARHMAKRGAEKRRRSVIETTKQIRRELGLDDDPRLRA